MFDKDTKTAGARPAAYPVNGQLISVPLISPPPLISSGAGLKLDADPGGDTGLALGANQHAGKTEVVKQIKLTASFN